MRPHSRCGRSSEDITSSTAIRGGRYIGLTGAFRWLVGARARDLEQYRSELARLDAAVDKSARCIRDELATALSERDEALDENERLCEALSKAKAREAALQDVIKAMAR